MGIGIGLIKWWEKCICSALLSLGLLSITPYSGIAYGLSKDKDGAASLSGLVAYLLVTTVLSTESVSMLRQIPVEEVSPAFGAIENAFIGIISGVVGASMYNRFYQYSFPKHYRFSAVDA